MAVDPWAEGNCLVPVIVGALAVLAGIARIAEAVIW